MATSIHPQSPPTAQPIGIHRVTVDDYDRRPEDSRVELIDGEVVAKMPKNSAHVYAVRATVKVLNRCLPVGWFAGKEDPVRIPDFDEPEPDVSVIRGEMEDYYDRIAEPADVALVVEASETTLGQDRGKKWTTYAKGGIPVYWIINLLDHQIEVYSQPGPNGYASSETFGVADTVPLVIAGVEIARIPVADLLRPRRQEPV